MTDKNKSLIQTAGKDQTIVDIVASAIVTVAILTTLVYVIVA